MSKLCTCPEQDGTQINLFTENGKVTCFVCNGEVRIKDVVLFSETLDKDLAMSEQELQEMTDAYYNHPDVKRIVKKLADIGKKVFYPNGGESRPII